MKLTITIQDLNYLLTIISYNAVDNDKSGVARDKRMYNKLKRQAEKQGFNVEEW